MFTPVVDISVHQANVNFGLMRARGVEGLIIRASHADDIDKRLEEHLAGALEGGFSERDIGFYGFVNPKRATGPKSARAAVDAIRRALGHTKTFYMVDIEDYTGEAPDKGSAPLFGPPFAAYLREHIREVRQLAPDMHVMAYANRSYWNGPVPGQKGSRWVDDAQLANELDWIVPRYHVLPSKAIRDAYVSAVNSKRSDLISAALVPLRQWQAGNAPPDPDSWASWALTVRKGVSGPETPSGVGWAGWQFSADWNAQGVKYGCPPTAANRRDPDLDLNIIRTAVWDNWTKRTGDVRFMMEVLQAGPDTLMPDQGLAPGEQRISKNGGTVLIHQLDGNVVVRRSNATVFATETAGSKSVALIMQTDGNLVLYDTDGKAVWHTNTHGNPGAGLRVENDGSIVVYSPAMKRLWSPQAAAAQAAAPIKAGRRTATVRANDGWIRIAKRELGAGGRWREIARLNGGETRVLHVGDVIVLPD